MRSVRRTLTGPLAAALLLGSGAVASAAPGQQPERPQADEASGELLHVGPDYNQGKAPAIDRSSASSQVTTFQEQADTPEVGDEEPWLALDDLNGVYFKDYTLRGEGEHVEVWVASGVADIGGEVTTGLDFPDGDCRNLAEPVGDRTVITDEQVDYFIDEFDNNIYPVETGAFSTPPDRDGTDNNFEAIFGLEGFENLWQGDGDNTVVLIDNVRDDNFYDTDNQSELSYIAGFHFSIFNEATDRNIMTVDGYDWLHRTGENPPDDPAPGDPCASAPARPLLYEGVFAHEWQHLLHYYEDPDETIWVNEGLSDYAQTITGYVDPSIPITEAGADSHIQCFLGYLTQETAANPNPREQSGPENSLTLWGDQGPAEILCDYGAVYTFFELVADHYGIDVISALHSDDGNGLASLTAMLEAAGETDTARDVVHRWAAMVALDAPLDDNGGTLQGGDATHYMVESLDASILWDNPEAYDTPGAPPNGSDYVRLRDEAGDFLMAEDVDTISFDGDETLPPLPLRWEIDRSPAGQTDDPALYSGDVTNDDRSAVTEISVPTADAQLSFDTKFSIEPGWDYGFVQISDDDGQTWTSLANDDTSTEVNPSARAEVQENVPGFNGYSQSAEPASRGIAGVCGGSSPDRFPDDDGSVHEPSIDCMAEFGITSGYQDGRYRPARSTSRAEMASLVVRTLQLVTGETLPGGGQDAFDDDNGSTHEANINRLFAAGIVEGDASGDFNPHDPVRRGQMTRFINRMIDFLDDGDATNGSRPVIREQNFFADDDDGQFGADVDALADIGVAEGTEAGRFRAAQDVTRAQMASFVMRGLDYVGSQAFAQGLPVAHWIDTSFDLSAYAGQDVLLRLRYITDPAVNHGGLWVDDVTVGGNEISDGASLEGFESVTQAAPTPTEDFTVQIVAYTEDGSVEPAAITEIELDDQLDGELSQAEVAAAIPATADVVSAIVMFDESTERENRYAPYTLTVNGVTQPGGR